MSVSLFFGEGGRALSRNKLRSTLAAMAIMIGIGAVVCVVAIGRAGSRRAEEQLQNLGDNFVWIEAGARAPNGVRPRRHGPTRPTPHAAQAILPHCPLLNRLPPHPHPPTHVAFS